MEVGMQPNLIVYIFMMVNQYGLERAAVLVNEVLLEHNGAVEQKPNRNGVYMFIPDARFSDSQCVLHSMLDKRIAYDYINIPTIKAARISL